MEVGSGCRPWFSRAWVASASLRDDPTVPESTHQPLPQRQLTHLRGPLGLSRLSSAAADLILLGNLTGRYATGSYSRLSSDGRSVLLREDRQGAAEHGHRPARDVEQQSSQGPGDEYDVGPVLERTEIGVVVVVAAHPATQQQLTAVQNRRRLAEADY
jgi:hypothetical protein